MNHKRGRPKNARAGCLMCKPWKMNGARGTGATVRGHRTSRRPVGDARRTQVGRDERTTVDENLADIRREVDAMPEGCTNPCCGGWP